MIPPGQTKVTRGAEFRAVISLDGDKSITNALKTETEPDTDDSFLGKNERR